MTNFTGAFSGWFHPEPKNTRSMLRLSFSSGDADCMQPGVRMLLPISALEAVPAVVTYYRIRVEATSIRSINGCAGCLSEISRNGTPLLRDAAVHLPFAPTDTADALAKRIHPETPEHLNFLMISSSNQVVPCAYRSMGVNSVPWAELFREPGDYRFHIVVTAAQMTSSINIALTWTGDWKTMEIKKAE